MSVLSLCPAPGGCSTPSLRLPGPLLLSGVDGGQPSSWLLDTPLPSASLGTGRHLCAANTCKASRMSLSEISVAKDLVPKVLKVAWMILFLSLSSCKQRRRRGHPAPGRQVPRAPPPSCRWGHAHAPQLWEPGAEISVALLRPRPWQIETQARGSLTPKTCRPTTFRRLKKQNTRG